MNNNTYWYEFKQNNTGGSFAVDDKLCHRIYNELSKDQLIYLIEQYYHSQFLIGEVCVDESQQHISSEKAIKKIRSYLYNMPNTYNVDNFKAQIDMGIGKITVDEYRKILELE